MELTRRAVWQYEAPGRQPSAIISPGLTKPGAATIIELPVVEPSGWRMNNITEWGER